MASDSSQSQTAGTPRRKSSVATIGLLILAIGVVLHLASNILIPVTLALIVSLLLSPFMRLVQRLRIPASIGAAFLVFSFLAVATILLVSLAEPAEHWFQEAQRTLRELQWHMRSARGELDSIEDFAKEIENLADVDDEVAEPAREVVVKTPGVIESMVGGLPKLFAFITVLFFLSYFFLAYRSSLLRRAAACGRTWSDRRTILVVAREVQSRLSLYLGTVTAINIVLGLLVAGLAWLLGVENPLLWGTMVALFNYAPYIGAITSLGVLFIVSLSSFDTLGPSLTLPLGFLVLTVIEGQLVTPSILGHRMSLNPPFVFLAVVLWGWMWGFVGALLAVPLLICFTTIAENVPGLRPTADYFRGGRKTGRGRGQAWR